MSLEDENINVEIKRVIGDDPKYDAWGIDALAWIERDGEKKFEKNLSLNVWKDDAEFEEDNDGIPHVVHRLRESYIDVVKEDPEFKSFSVQSLENEKEKAKDLEGEEFEI